MPWPVAFGGPVRGSSPPEPTSWRDTREERDPQSGRERSRGPGGAHQRTEHGRSDGRNGRSDGRRREPGGQAGREEPTSGRSTDGATGGTDGATGGDGSGAEGREEPRSGRSTDGATGGTDGATGGDGSREDRRGGSDRRERRRLGVRGVGIGYCPGMDVAEEGFGRRDLTSGSMGDTV